MCPHSSIRPPGSVCEGPNAGPDGSPGPGQENLACPAPCSSLLKPRHPGETKLPDARMPQWERVQWWQPTGLNSPKNTPLAPPLPQDLLPGGCRPSGPINNLVVSLVSPCFPQPAGFLVQWAGRWVRCEKDTCLLCPPQPGVPGQR